MNVTINNSVPSKSQKSGKLYQQVTYNNDQKASSWDDDFTKLIGQTVEVEVKENGGFKNIKLVGGVKASASSSSAAPTKETSEVDVNYKSIVLSLEVLKSTAVTITEQSLLNEAAKIKGYLQNGFPTTENKG